MPFLEIAKPDRRPRILIINPNSSLSFSESTRSTLPTDSAALDCYTAPLPSPPGINGEYDSIISATVCLRDLRSELSRWDGFVVACFSHHPLTAALRELTTAPVISILSAPILYASSLGARVGILTTGPRWVPLLAEGLAALHLSPLCSVGIVSSGLSPEDLHRMPEEEVIERLGRSAKEELEEKRGADVIILGCAGMGGLENKIKDVCKTSWYSMLFGVGSRCVLV